MNKAPGPEPVGSQPSLEHLLQSAHGALDAGNVQSGRDLAQQVLKVAEAQKNSYFEASALLCLAHCDRMVSRYRRAHRASQRAAHLFQGIEHVSGEVMALSSLAIASINLGRSEDAVEAALLSVRLSELLPRPEHSVLAFNDLGVAYFWSRSFDKADQALASAIRIAEAATPALDTFQPRVNQWWSETIRLFHERYYTGALAPLDRMRQLKALFVRLVGLRAPNITTGAVVLFATALEACWQGKPQAAAVSVEALAQEARRYGSVTWLIALEFWARAEIAMALKDLEGATTHTQKMIDVAVDMEHEQLACLGHLLVSQLYVDRGMNGPALDELRRLRLREQLIRTDSLESREKVVAWQVEHRQQQKNMLNMQLASRQLEKLSMEDPLTGIANRRKFEQHATELLHQGQENGRPPCIAMIDVDRFKQINDTFSHQTGDEVLKRISQLLTAHLREEDLPARLAGDEFVIVFKHSDLATAALVCERIRRAVADFDWRSVAAGLQVGISIGVERARAGDTLESVTHRSDMAMYQTKKKRS